MPTKTTKKEEEKTMEISTPSGKYFYANGKRKTSVAKVRLYQGKGEITVNGLDVKTYFPIKDLVERIKSPLKISGANKNYDIVVKVRGGGIHSQADAVNHGVAKALVVIDPLNKPALKKAGMLSRDSRVKERKKYGLKRARKAPQFSKR